MECFILISRWLLQKFLKSISYILLPKVKVGAITWVILFVPFPHVILLYSFTAIDQKWRMLQVDELSDWEQL